MTKISGESELFDCTLQVHSVKLDDLHLRASTQLSMPGPSPSSIEFNHELDRRLDRPVLHRGTKNASPSPVFIMSPQSTLYTTSSCTLHDHNFTSNYYHFLDPPNLQILRLKLGNPGADRILAAPGFANLEGPNWEILRILANFWSS